MIHTPSDRSRPLRAALAANALFSAITGAMLATLAAQIGNIIGFEFPLVLRLVGFGLLLFAGFVAFVGSRNRVSALSSVLVSLADLAWVIGTVAVLSISDQAFNDVGVTTLLAVALIVLACAVLQLLGARHMLRETAINLGDWHYCIASDVDAPPDLVWRIVSDLGSISRYMSSLAHSTVRPRPSSHAGHVGTIRDCTTTAGDTWSETCTAFDESQRSFAVRFVTEAAGFPYPMREMHGGWKVEARGDASRVIVWWSVTPTISVVPWLLVAMMGNKIDRDFPQVIARMSASALGRTFVDGSERRPSLAGC